MGTRMVSSAESPAHQNWEDAIVATKATDTLFLKRKHSPALRAPCTKKAQRLRIRRKSTQWLNLALSDLYFGGDLKATQALTGHCQTHRLSQACSPDSRRGHTRIF